MHNKKHKDNPPRLAMIRVVEEDSCFQYPNDLIVENNIHYLQHGSINFSANFINL